MKYLEQYVSVVRTELPDIEARLNSGAKESDLQKLEMAAGCELPRDFVTLYSRFDGEIPAMHTGFLAGLMFLPLERVYAELSFFQNAEEEMTSMGTRAMREEPICSLKWIPFAFDNSRAYLFLDMSPAKEGKTGQVIAVDYDRNQCWLLADSLDMLFERMTQWLKSGILTVNTADAGGPFIMEATGHLFNVLDKLTAQTAEGVLGEVRLPSGFWQERYKAECVPVSRLAKEKTLFLKGKTIDCTPFQYMENLKELILHNCILENAGYMAKAPQLKKMFLVNCTLEEESLAVLAEAPQLKELSINKMGAEGLSALRELKTLKSLSLSKAEGVKTEELAAFTGLQELYLEDMGLHDGMFIAELKNLKTLHLCYHVMDNLQFLQALTKLTAFSLSETALDEGGLLAVRELKKLKEFIYPVRDLQVYQNHPALEKVGMAADVEQDFAVFAGSKVNSFTVCGDISREKLEEMAEKMGKYVKIGSFGYQAKQS